MAIEPSGIVGDVAERAHRLGAPPRMLRQPPGAGAPLLPLQPGETIGTLHREWARLHDESAAAPPPGRGALASARARLKSVAAQGARPALEADRALIGDLIRAVDTLAARADELAGRLIALESLVEEVVVVTSEDLTNVRAALGHVAGAPAPPPRAADG